MRYWPSVVLLCVCAVAFASAIWLLVSGDGVTGGWTLLLEAVGLAAFIGAALAVGRIRRIRGLTLEAIIGHRDPPAD